jgi:hypothetical protein
MTLFLAAWTTLAAWPALVLGDVAPPTLLQQLDGLTRVKLFLALIGFVALAVGVGLLIWLGARYARLYMRDPEPAAPRRPRDDDWSDKPLAPP